MRVANSPKMRPTSPRQTGPLHRKEAAIRGAQKEIQRNISQGTSGDIGGGWSQRDTGGGTVSFSGPSGESIGGYSNTEAGIGAASADWGSS